MTIQRFETGPRMSQAVVHGNTVYLAGVVAGKAAGKSVTEQTQDILAIIDGHLEKAGTDGARRGVSWNINRDRSFHRATASSTIAVRRAASTRPWSLPFTCAAGPNAQLPRQNTCSTVSEPSGAVSPSDIPHLSRT